MLDAITTRLDSITGTWQLRPIHGGRWGMFSGNGPRNPDPVLDGLLFAFRDLPDTGISAKDFADFVLESRYSLPVLLRNVEDRTPPLSLSDFWRYERQVSRWEQRFGGQLKARIDDLGGFAVIYTTSRERLFEFHLPDVNHVEELAAFLVHLLADARHLVDQVKDLATARIELRGGASVVVDHNVELTHLRRFIWRPHPKDGRIWNGRDYLGDLLEGADPLTEETRHLNGDKLDHRRVNLAVVDVSEPYTIRLKPELIPGIREAVNLYLRETDPGVLAAMEKKLQDPKDPKGNRYLSLFLDHFAARLKDPELEEGTAYGST